MDLERYNQYNESFNRLCTFKIGICSGFFSEYNNMILAMAYCLLHRIRFQLTSNDANFNREKGWQGYFLPFCHEVSDSKNHYRTWDYRYALKRIVFQLDFSSIASLYPYLFPWKKRLRTQDIFGKCRNKHQKDSSFRIFELGFEGDFQQLCAELVKMTWRYNEETEDRISRMIQTLNLPAHYVSVHVRRGDKIVEANHMPISQYMDKLGDGCRNLFVATDDYSVVEEIRAHYPDWAIWTLCTPLERGYMQSAADQECAEEKDRNMITLFATMEILNRAELFVGTYSSNMGMFMGMRNPSICRSVDFDHWLIW